MAKLKIVRYTESYVAFLDILGFREIIRTGAFDEILKIFRVLTTDGFVTSFTRAAGGEDFVHKYNESLSKVNLYVMSDSAVVSTPCNTPYPLESLIDACIYFQNMLYDLDTPVLLRGAVAKGDYYHKNAIAFGRAMVEAYQCEENYCIYPRIILSNELMQEIRIEDYRKKLVFDEEDRYWHIDCLKEYLDGKKEDSEECRKFRRLIDKYINGYGDAHIREKYMWLDDEYNRVANKIQKGKLGIVVEENS